MADQARRAALLSIGLLLLVFAGGLYLSSRLLLGRPAFPFGGGSVAVLPIVGVIYAERSFGRDLVALRRRDEVKAFVLEIRSPGGSVGASQELYSQVKRLREEDDRPVLAWIGDVGASGGYYVALGADSIFALPGSITGSIGVIMQFPQAEELLREVCKEEQKAADVISQAVAEGIAKRTLQRAAGKLCFRRRAGFGQGSTIYWTLKPEHADAT